MAEHPERYIHVDEALVPMLRALRESGKKTFLLTNSLWDFTNVVMNYLVHGAVGEDKTSDWTELFDAIITGSCKPAFFENERAAIFEVDAETSDLRNTDDGAPMLPIGASAAAATADDALRSSFGGMGKGKHEGVKAYQGGSFKHLHAMLGVTSGSQVLYVGDHIYGDILRSKKDARVAHHARGARAAARARVPAARGRGGIPGETREASTETRRAVRRRAAQRLARRAGPRRGVLGVALRGVRRVSEASEESPSEASEESPSRAMEDAHSRRRMRRSARRSRRRRRARRRRTGWACASFTPRSIRCGVR